MFADIVEANGSGVDTVSGATFTSAAIRNAVNDAAEQAGCTNMDAFKSNKVVHEAQAPIEETYDVVIVGAGGAGIAAAAQAAQDGQHACWSSRRTLRSAATPWCPAVSIRA